MDAKESLSRLRRIIGLIDGMEQADLTYLIARLNEVVEDKAAEKAK